MLFRYKSGVKLEPAVMLLSIAQLDAELASGSTQFVYVLKDNRLCRRRCGNHIRLARRRELDVEFSPFSRL